MKPPLLLLTCLLSARLAAATYGLFEYSVSNDEVTITGYRYDHQTFQISIPATINGLPVTTIADQAFFSLSDWIYSITIPDMVTSIGDGAFRFCTSLTEINVGAGNFVFASLDGVLFDHSRETLVQFPPGRSGEYSIPSSVTTIRERAFESSHSITRLTVPESVTSIGAAAFAYTYGLTSVSLPDSISSIESSVFLESGLTSVTIPDSVMSIGDGAFESCPNLTSVTLGNSVTSLGDRAFRLCSNLTSVTFSQSLTSIGASAFSYCTSLTSMTLPDSVTYIGSYSLSNCTSLTHVRIPASLTSIDFYPFDDCPSLVAIDVDPDNPAYASDNGVLWSKISTTLMRCPEAYRGVYTVPDGITVIGRYAFQNCRYLTSVILPASVTRLYVRVFDKCPRLLGAFFLGTRPSTESGTFLGTPPGFVLYHLFGILGWINPLHDIPTAFFVPWGGYGTFRRETGYYADTGNWLGQPEISLRPFVWHGEADMWLYTPEPIWTSGGWVYLHDLAPGLLVMIPGTNWAYSFVLHAWLMVKEADLEAHAGWVYVL